jgi:hypothetical protein
MTCDIVFSQGALKRIFFAAVFGLFVEAIPAHGEELSRREALELQKECGLQAAKAFEQAGFKVGELTNGSTADYESHYNPGMNKCFMAQRVLIATYLQTARGTKSWASTYLLDAYEQRIYAELDITDLPWLGDPVGHRRISRCDLMPLHEGKRTCRSEAEYTSFVERYMEAIVQTQDTLVNPDRH